MLVIYVNKNKINDNILYNYDIYYGYKSYFPVYY